MTDHPTPLPDPQDARRTLVRQSHAIWEQRAAFWDDLPADGDPTHHRLVVSTVDGLLAAAPGEHILEIACGSGALARHLANLGAVVMATDFSETFIARASRNPQPAGKHVEYRVVDATDERDLLALGRHRFQAAVCNMSLSDIATIEPLFRALPMLLAPGGRFVFTIPHPCFNHAASHIVSETDASLPEPSTRHALRLDNYLRVPDAREQQALRQPATPLAFHRPLSDILNAAFNAGLMMDGVAEPAYPDASPGSRNHAWTNLPNIPPVFAARFRPARDLGR